MNNRSYLTPRISKEDQEIEERRSIEAFLMAHIYPKQGPETKTKILKLMQGGMSATGAFEAAGVDLSMCIRK